MSEEIIIRDYKTEEELEWLDLLASVMVDSYAWWEVKHKKKIHKNVVIDLVACDKDRLVGFTVAEIDEGEKDTAFVWDFGVHRNYRGKNIGWKMIQRLHKIMNEKYGLQKSIWYSQDPDSIKYYEHLGMKEIGRHWQLSVKPTTEQFKYFKKDKFCCWYMRGDCALNDLEDVKKNFITFENDDTAKPMICVGFEFIK
ncbi:MAG: GNAT family N-acetyltransferase [Bacteroidota bacterium]|nr:GNAT family N-acetyltransferase [Bacteroidota bacterium]